jgi:hypothetical protein
MKITIEQVLTKLFPKQNICLSTIDQDGAHAKGMYIWDNDKQEHQITGIDKIPLILETIEAKNIINVELELPW